LGKGLLKVTCERFTKYRAWLDRQPLSDHIAGHKKLEMTRRYSLPTAADKALALEGLLE
jgi:hypothetical protein